MGDKGGFRVTAEMLKSITYPTHGRTEFIYEPNVISSMVSADRKTVQSAHLPYPGTPDYTYPGGLRIKEINNYDSNDELLTRKLLLHKRIHTDNKGRCLFRYSIFHSTIPLGLAAIQSPQITKRRTRILYLECHHVSSIQSALVQQSGRVYRIF